jgi:tetratricopeptide (TPR) repeat protein
LGKIHYQLGNLDQALHALEMAAQFTNAKDGDYVFELKARVFLQKKEFQTGLDTVRTIPGKARRPYVHWTEADLLLGLGQADKAKEVLHRSAERDRRSQPEFDGKAFFEAQGQNGKPDRPDRRQCSVLPPVQGMPAGLRNVRDRRFAGDQGFSGYLK